MPRTAEWESRWWSPVINAEHLAMRESAALIDLSAFAVLDVSGPGALAAVQHIAVAQMDVGIGRVIYTSLLDDAGGFRGDLTIMRLAADRFRIVTGGATGQMDLKWITDHLPAGRDAVVSDVTSAWTTLGLWGPQAREILTRITSDDVSHPGMTFGTCKEIEAAGLTVLASRISYVGELGWELYVPMEEGGKLWDALWDAGQPSGLIPAGIGVYGTPRPPQKGYRPFGNEPAAVMCTLTMDDHASSTGELRYPLGCEPVLGPDGAVLTDSRGRTSYVTSAGSGPSVGKHILLAYLPAADAVEGRSLAIEYLGEQYPVTVAVAGSTPLFDPANDRIRC
jgi:glycine cleavage system aminomethyltransferase T